MRTLLSTTLVTFLVASGVGCLSEDSGFGRRCIASGECPAGDVCVDDRCVPARRAGDRGESCAAPLAMVQPDEGATLAVGEASLAGAGLDFEGSCGGGEVDVVFAFTLHAPAGLRIRAEADPKADARVSLRPLDEDRCAIELADGCGEDGELLYARADEGTWAVVVHGTPSAALDPVVRVTVERLDCPLGYLPFDEGHCAGFREVAPPGIPRSGARLSTLPDGRGILTGGIEADGVAAAAGEVFEPASETWSYVAFRSRRPTHSPVLLGDRFLVLGGGAMPEILDHEPGGADDITRIDYDLLVPGVDDFDDNDLEMGVGFPSGKLVIVVDDDTLLMEIDTPVYRCSNDLDCVAYGTAICATRLDPSGVPLPDGFCLCEAGPCEAPSVLRTRVGVLGTEPRGAASAQSAMIAANRDDAELVLLHNGDQIFEMDVSAQFWRSIALEGTPRRAVGMDAIPNGAIVTGGNAGGSATSRVERVHTATRDVEPLTAMRVARIGHGHTRLLDGRILVVGGSDASGAHASAELVDPDQRQVPKLPQLPMALENATASTLVNGRVLIVGNEAGDLLMRHAMVFEIVAPDFRAPELSATALCGPLVSLEVPTAADESGALSTRETTAGERDRFRESSCGSDDDTIGPERLFTFEIFEPASVHATTHQERTTVVLWRGACEDREVLGCVTTGTAFDLAEAPTLPAGRYTMAVEAHQSYYDASGLVFDLVTYKGEPRPCELGPEDPDDDSAGGARRMEPSFPPYDMWDASDMIQHGTQCAGDDDHVLVEVWSAESHLSLDSTSLRLATLAPAIIDDQASLAAGEPVFSFGPAVALGRGKAAPGLYALRLVVGEDDPLRHHWTVHQTTGHCVPDDGDSLAPVLDDERYAPSRPRFNSGERAWRCVTSPEDVDVSLFPLPAGSDSAIQLLDGYATTGEVFAVEGPDAPLGNRLGELVAVGASLGLPAGVSPWVAVVTRTDHPFGEVYALELITSLPGDSCFNALSFSDSGTLAIDSTPYANDLTPEILGDCTSYAAFGDDVVGALELNDGDRLDASLDPIDGNDDVSLYLLNTCEPVSSACVSGADEGGAGATESVSWVHAGAPATYYLVADGYDEAPFAATLSWSVTRAGP